MSDVSTDTADLTFEFDLEAAPEKVWRAICEPALREAWLGEPEAGPCEVAAQEPGSRLDLVWPMREGDSLVSLRISEGEDGGAHLTIIHRSPVAASVVALRPRSRRPAMQACAWRMAA
jgi:uncharacterized protein YndB with AHSA1/START domain